jgi:hypothetical protein
MHEPILIRHIRGMRSCCWSGDGPAQQGRGVDRGCPLSTALVRLIWHAGGTASNEARVDGRLRRSAPLLVHPLAVVPHPRLGR